MVALLVTKTSEGADCKNQTKNQMRIIKVDSGLDQILKIIVKILYLSKKNIVTKREETITLSPRKVYMSSPVFSPFSTDFTEKN